MKNKDDDEPGVLRSLYIIRCNQNKYNKRKTKSGAVYLSAIANVPIIPVHITVRPKFFSTVTVTFGDAIFPDKAVLKNKKLLKENATKLINRIYDIN